VEPIAWPVSRRAMHSLDLGDQALLSRFRQGDAGAFEALYERHHDRVRAILYRLAGGEADDLTQEVFLRLYRRPPRQCGGSLGPWLCRVALNLGYNALRGRRRWESHRDRLGTDALGLGWIAPTPDPPAELERHEEQRRVRRALSALKQRDAALLVLRYSGFSYREVAETLRISPKSVGTLLARAERAFRQAYDSLQGGAGEGRDGGGGGNDEVSI